MNERAIPRPEPLLLFEAVVSREGRGEGEKRGERGKGRASSSSGKGQRGSHVPERARPAAPDDARPARVAARVRAELSDIIARGEMRDPMAMKAIISSIEVTRDLSLVKVGLRALDPDTKESERTLMVKAFQRAAGFLRARVGKSLAIRTSPELRFAWDTGIDHAARVEELLRDDREPPPEEGGAA